jgi:hypothetical protein
MVAHHCRIFQNNTIPKIDSAPEQIWNSVNAGMFATADQIKGA